MANSGKKNPHNLAKMCHFFPPKRKNHLYRLHARAHFFSSVPSMRNFAKKTETCSSSGNHLYCSLAKFGYKQDMNSKKNLIILCIFGDKLEKHNREIW
jgi:hypothetical protein